MSSLPADVFPLDTEQTNNLRAAVSGLSAEQLHWVSGYAAGLAAVGQQHSNATDIGPSLAANSGPNEKQLTVLYGSQTGNGEALAEMLVEQARQAGFGATAISLSDYKPSNLKRESLVTFVISTHGEGDPPDDAEIFHEFLFAAKAPQLSNLNYSVLALGDSSYVKFCQTGREFDARLAELGAKSFAATVECDLDYDEPAASWTSHVLAELPNLIDAGQVTGSPVLRAVESVSAFGKTNPFPAEVLVNQKITGGSSTKDVRHIELSLEGSGLSYEPGDALAVVAENPPALVQELLHELGFDAADEIDLSGESIDLASALKSRLEVTTLSLGFLRDWAKQSNSEQLISMLAESDPQVLGDFVDQYQVIDVVREFPAKVDANQFAAMLRRLSPRSYSIASSLAANPDEVHLTVAAVRYDAFGSQHWGAASTHLADRIDAGDTVSVFVEHNKRFHLPSDDVPIVMIGPGTGVAPFRAFVEERKERGASGSNWLFFGDRNFDSDFLYQLEWQRYLKQGALDRLDVAFSRDQSHKVYVQDRIRANGAELHQWIERGAAIYVCGDAKRMAAGVNTALLEVLQDHGGLDADAAAQKMKDLRSAGRYQRDVY